MNWYIGMEIVVVKRHSGDVIKEGQEFVIKGLQSSQCNCNDVEIDIGIKQNHTHTYCFICNKRWESNSFVYWFAEKLFAPKQTMTEAETAVKELMKPIEILK